LRTRLSELGTAAANRAPHRQDYDVIVLGAVVDVMPARAKKYSSHFGDVPVTIATASQRRAAQQRKRGGEFFQEKMGCGGALLPPPVIDRPGLILRFGSDDDRRRARSSAIS
jgi:hypothetical protein